jgi:hypothetical protein
MAPCEFEASLADVRLFDALLDEALEPTEVRKWRWLRELNCKAFGLSVS